MKYEVLEGYIKRQDFFVLLLLDKDESFMPYYWLSAKVRLLQPAKNKSQKSVINK